MQLYSIPAEENIMGALLQNKLELLEEIKIEYFHAPNNRSILKAILDLKAKGIGVDYATITKQLKNNRTTDPIHDIPNLIGNTLPAEIESNIKLIKDLYKRRTTIDTLYSAIERLKNINESIDSINTTIVTKIDNLIFEDDTMDDSTPAILKKLSEDLKTPIYDIEDNPYKYGIPRLDYMTYGIHKEELTTIAAKSGIGKTALAIQITYSLLSNGLKVLFTSREMSDVQIYKRLFVNFTGIKSSKYRNRAFTKEEWDRVNTHVQIASDCLDFYVNTQISTITEIKKRIRQIKPDVVIIDYIQLLTPERTESSREREVATISREIKNMTQDFKISIIQLSQLNDEFGDNLPHGERAMRESKAIYQNSNNVIYIHKPNTKEIGRYIKKGYLTMEKVEEIEGAGNEIMEIILDKQRDGQTGRILQQYQRDLLRFIPIEGTYNPDKKNKKIPEYEQIQFRKEENNKRRKTTGINPRREENIQDHR